jgi:prevent-host-death family protein
MRERISATAAARSFSDLLNRVRYKGDSFVIVRNGEEVGCLEPVTGKRPKTFNELVEMLRAMGPPDEDFARDLEEIHRSQPALPDDPWRS